MMMINWKHSFCRLWQKGELQARYFVAGALNTAFSLVIYPALLWAFPYFQHHYMQGLAISQPVGIIFSFLTQKVGVFRTPAARIVPEFIRYVSFYIGYFALNWICLPLLVEVMRIPPIIAQTSFQVIAILGGYLWHSRVTFAQKERAGSR